MLGFWYRLVNDINVGCDKVSTLMLRMCYGQREKTPFKFQWLEHVRILLEKLGLPYFWQYQTHSLEQFKNIVRQRLQDQFLQLWYRELEENSVCCNYRLFKQSFCFEEYLNLLPLSLRQSFLRFRLVNHKLPVQQKRLHNMPREERFCTLCDSREIGDEFHYVFNCANPVLKNSRRENLQRYFLHHPNVLKFHDLMNTTSKAKLVKLSRFVCCILKQMG